MAVMLLTTARAGRRSTPPGEGDRWEQAVLDLVPRGSAWWKEADGHCQVSLGSERREFDFPFYDNRSAY